MEQVLDLAQRPPKARKRSRFPRIMLAIAVVLAMATGSAGIVVLRYRPLEARSGGGGVVGAKVTGQDAPVGFSPSVVYTVHFTPNTTWSYLFPINNVGHWGVTITGVHLRGSNGQPLRPVALLMEPPDRCCLINDAVPFKPFALRPGETRQLVARYEFTNCIGTAPAPKSYGLWDSTEQVTFTVLGIPKEMAVAYDMRIVFDGLPSCGVSSHLP